MDHGIQSRNRLLQKIDVIRSCLLSWPTALPPHSASSRATSRSRSSSRFSICKPSRIGRDLQFHRIDNSKDPNFWSVRVSRDIRIIVHKTGASLLLAYVGHHDDAYRWAERRRIETHPKTGALQIVEIRERVEEVTSEAAGATRIRVWSADRGTACAGHTGGRCHCSPSSAATTCSRSACRRTGSRMCRRLTMTASSR